MASSWRFGASRRQGIGWSAAYGAGPASSHLGGASYWETAEEEEEPPRKASRLGDPGFEFASGRPSQDWDPEHAASVIGDIAPPRSRSVLEEFYAVPPSSQLPEGRAPSPQRPQNSSAVPAPSLQRLDEDSFVTEVMRIVRCPVSDPRQVLGLQPADRRDLQAVQSRYRQLMRLLHPDKRKAEEEIRAGGREVCDEAVRRVQEAHEAVRRVAAPQSSGNDGAAASTAAASAPTTVGHSSGNTATATAPVRQQEEDSHMQRLRRMQEIQRQQARQAMQRTQWAPSAFGSDVPVRSEGSVAASTMQPEATPTAPPHVDDLLNDINKILAGPADNAPQAVEPPRDPRMQSAHSDIPMAGSAATTSQLINLLAGLR